MKNLTKTLLAFTLSIGMGQAAQATSLSADAEDAIFEALMDEYKAEAVYTALISEFGTDTAFANIVLAEQKHSDALIRLLVKYDADVPDNPYLDGSLPLPDLPDTLAEAYEAGVIGEIDNLSLYRDDLLPVVTEYPDITRVFTNLMTASETKHLPAFARAADAADSDVRHVMNSRAPETTFDAPGRRAQRGGGGGQGGKDGKDRGGNGQHRGKTNR